MEEQPVRFCTSVDGVRLAYALSGKGQPIVKAANWMGNLEFDVQGPWKHWIQELSKDHSLLRFDQRGCGLSDRRVQDISPDAWVRDLEMVVDAAGLDRFTLLGLSQGGATCIEYAMRHPNRVSHLVLFGTFARGWNKAGRSAAQIEEWETTAKMIGIGWGRDNPAFRQFFTSLFMPDATAEQMQSFNELQRASTSAETAVRFYRAFGDIDVFDLLSKVSVPTLIFHVRGDQVVRFGNGRQVAAGIPGARFVALEGRSHLPLEDEPAWREFLAEFRRFVPGEAPTSDAIPRATAKGPSVDAATLVKTSVGEEAHALLKQLSHVPLSRYKVVGGYSRFDESARQVLKDLRQKIAGAFRSTTPKRENYLIWAPPGTGKTFFVQQVAAGLQDQARYVELNLAQLDGPAFRTALAAAQEAQGACICFVDEADAKQDEPWPYETLLPVLDRAAAQTVRFVFVLAGSSGSSLAELKERIASRPKGADLLSRIPSAQEYTIPAMSMGDRVLVALSQLSQTGKRMDREITEVEKMALCYVALSPRLSSARQLAEFAVRCVERLPPAEDRIRYDSLFDPGDPENKSFWMAAQGFSGDLANAFISIED